MTRKRFTDEQIITVLRKHETGAKTEVVPEIRAVSYAWSVSEKDGLSSRETEPVQRRIQGEGGAGGYPR